MRTASRTARVPAGDHIAVIKLRLRIVRPDLSLRGSGKNRSVPRGPSRMSL